MAGRLVQGLTVASSNPVATQLSVSLPQQWDPTSHIAAASENTSVLFRTYYVGENKEVYERYKQGDTWTGESDQSPVWPTADRPGAGIAAVGWQDQIRLYYISTGRLVEEVLMGGNWSQGQEW